MQFSRNLPIQLMRAARQQCFSRYLIGLSLLAVISVSLHTLDETAQGDDILRRVFAMGIPLAVPFGARLATLEIRSGALTQVLIRRPQRRQWLQAQLGSVFILAILSFGVFWLSALFAVAGFAGLRKFELVPERGGSELILSLLFGLLLSGLFAICGALGGLMYGDLPTTIAWLLWYFVIELIVAAQIPDIARFLPGGGVNSVLGLSPGGSPLIPLAAVTVFALAHFGLTLGVFRRRDLS